MLWKNMFWKFTMAITTLVITTMFASCSVGRIYDTDTTESLSLSISPCTTVADYAQQISINCGFTSELALDRVEITFDGYDSITNSDPTSMIFYYSKYIDSSMEGGKIEAAKVFVDAENSLITQQTHFVGSSKFYSEGGNGGTLALNKCDFDVLLADILDNADFTLYKDIDCYAEMTFVNLAFSDEEEPYMRKSCEIHSNGVLVYRNSSEM
ncbi:MAG: hypothetical protein K2M82_00445 [Lachnospiraceae bacterium]|nr:hypothetical protein [Lachnospiraceae bacterium]